MPLLKPPQPQLATRRLYLRMDEPLAQTAERYAEFIGTDKLHHVVTQALAFIFNRDRQFEQWLAERPILRSLAGETKNRAKKQLYDGAEP